MTKDIINFKVEELSSFSPNCNPYIHDLYRQGVQVGDAVFDYDSGLFL